MKRKNTFTVTAKKLVCFVLCITLMLSMGISALAKTNEASAFDEDTKVFVHEIDPNATIEDTSKPDPGLVITRGNTSTLLFSYIATNVQNTVNTSITNKTFTKASLTDGYLRITGTATFSPSLTTSQNEEFEGGPARAGGTRRSPSNSNLFLTYPGQYLNFRDGIYKAGSVSASEFTSGVTYYGFATNAMGTSWTISGTFYLYNANY